MRSPADVWQAVYEVFVADLKARVGFDLPNRQAIVAGDVAMDCEQFIVQGGPSYQGPPGQHIQGFQQATGGLSVHAVDVNVIIDREIETSGGANVVNAVPDVEDLTNASLKVGNDMNALTETFWAHSEDGKIAAVCDDIYFGGCEIVGAQGLILRTVLQLAVEI